MTHETYKMYTTRETYEMRETHKTRSTVRTASVASLLLVSALALAACGDDSSNDAESSAAATTAASGSGDHSAHEHSMDGGAAPAGIQDAAHPTYPVGTQVTLDADHMPGMKGATAVVTGAFSTTTYSVSYTPTDGGEPVKDHRWVVHEELDNPGTAPLADGTTVTLEADHMPGMKGATATIDYSTQETVYMVDLTTEDGMTMKNHKWVTESELRAAD